MRNIFLIIACTAGVITLGGCSSAKFLKDGQSVLSEVKVVSADKNVPASSFERYVSAQPNSKWFGLVKMPLGIYCMAGKDTSRNRLLHRLGEPPVIYDPQTSEKSVSNLRNALINRGYLKANAAYKEFRKKHKTKVEYTIFPGELYTVDKIAWNIPNPDFRKIVDDNVGKSLLYKGMPCNLSILGDERSRIVQLLQDNGYYGANNDFVSFTADTSRFSKNVSLAVNISSTGGEQDSIAGESRYFIDRVNFYTNVNIDSLEAGKDVERDTLTDYEGKKVYSYGHRMLRRGTILRNVYFRPGDLFSQTKVQNTYQRLGSLPITDFSSVRINEIAPDSLAFSNSTDSGGRKTGKLQADIYFNSRNLNSVSFELDGTNMAGDLGAAASLSFENRNVFHGGETFGMKLRGAYEAISGLKGYNNDENYFEVSVEANLKMPLLIRPLDRNKKRPSIVDSELSLMYDTQDRPEFHRRTLTAGLRYLWNSWQGKLQHRLDLVSLNYVFMPWISDTFRKDYLENNTSRNSVLKYSYEDLFIMRTSYNLVFSSKGKRTPGLVDYTDNAYRLRFGVETAGNLLYLFSKIFNNKKNSDGHYKLFNIAFAQYAKFDVDFVKNFVIDDRNALAFHTGFGIAIPYGNASVIPYEKRYFAGGANSVRGWSVRELGPGKFRSRDGKIDFINQTGNIKLDVNLEYRTFLFWKLHGAVFVDCGNIWTTHDYSDQPGGKFEFQNFFKQLAASYGLGLRLNLDYFVLRFDGGMKAVNPYYSNQREHFPIFHPIFSRDFTFHFAVGLPF